MCIDPLDLAFGVRPLDGHDHQEPSYCLMGRQPRMDEISAPQFSVSRTTMGDASMAAGNEGCFGDTSTPRGLPSSAVTIRHHAWSSSLLSETIRS